MKCPACDCELKQETYQQIINFRCPDCGGRMMTLSGLRSLCGDRNFVNTLWNTAQYGYSEPGPACTSCRKAMRRVTLPLSGRALELDVCCACRQVWFDASELERIPPPRPEPREELPQKAREALAMHKIETEKTRVERVFGNSESEHAPDEGWQYIAALLGMPVELDAPGCRRLPVITWSIAIVCLIVFGLTYAHLQQAIDNWGFIPAQWARHGGLTVLTSMFLHGGVLHLLGNLYFLLVFGDNVEDEFGRMKYIALLVASGLGATLLHGLFDPRSGIPCVGASGFISGVIACYAICFPRVRLSFLLAPRNSFGLYHSWQALPAWGVFFIWMVFQIVMAAVFRSDSGGGTAYLAHLGGIVPGVLFAVYYHFRRNRECGEDEGAATEMPEVSKGSKSLDDLKNTRNL